ncbi:Helix-turn-helix domain protein [mine drainage metagenome]|uniref:Helix-turn-helix domain protein n=1 Tax=mine drainage metagenome TaxID=410659 RepID=T1A5R2_9ZZZZ
MQDLTERIRAEMAREGIGLRELGRRSGIDHSLISRLLRGASSPTPALLQRLAPVLGLSAAELYRAAGIKVAPPIEDALRAMGAGDGLDEARLRDHLTVLAAQAQTASGRRKILREFPRKRRDTALRGPILDCLDGLHAAYRSGLLPPALDSEVGAALLYFIQPGDCIPDDHFPLGYLDDAMVVQLVWPKVVGQESPDSTLA